jgi:hypothetical protein
MRVQNGGVTKTVTNVVLLTITAIENNGPNCALTQTESKYIEIRCVLLQGEI